MFEIRLKLLFESHPLFESHLTLQSQHIDHITQTQIRSMQHMSEMYCEEKGLRLCFLTMQAVHWYGFIKCTLTSTK